MKILMKKKSQMHFKCFFPGLKAVKGMCNKFVECYKGLATVKECPPGTEFCVKSLMCDWPSKAVCDRVQMGPGHRVTMSSSVHSVTSSVSETNLVTPSESSSAGGYQYQQPLYHQPASDEQYEDINWSGNQNVTNV